MTSNQRVTVFGAYGHTGRFVVSELRQRGWTPILSGRDPDKLNALGDVHPGLDLRPAASMTQPRSIARLSDQQLLSIAPDLSPEPPRP